MDFIKQFIGEYYEYILGVLGLGGAGVGGKKAYKAYQDRRDNKQEGKIAKLEERMDKVELAIESNTKDDLTFRENIEKIVGDTNDKLSSFMKRYFDDRDSDQAKTIEKLEKQVETLSRQRD